MPIKKVVLDERYIDRAWRNIGVAGSLSALHGFTRSRGIKDLRAADRALSKIEAYSLHRPIKRKIKRRAMILRGPRHTFCFDLADMQSMSRSNSGFKWIFVCLDCFTKELFCAALKTKSNEDVLNGFKQILKQAKTPPKYAYSDMGLEFVGGKMKAYYKKMGIHHYVSHTKQKAWMCERVIRTLKERLYRYMTLTKSKRWVDALPEVVKAYNNTVHASHGFKPSEIKKRDVDQVFINMYDKLIKTTMKKRPPPKYKVGDVVRIAKNRLAFDKGYTAGFTTETFRVAEVMPTHPVYTYKLESMDGEPVQSSFLAEELGLAAAAEDKIQDGESS